MNFKYTLIIIGSLVATNALAVRWTTVGKFFNYGIASMPMLSGLKTLAQLDVIEKNCETLLENVPADIQNFCNDIVHNEQAKDPFVYKQYNVYGSPAAALGKKTLLINPDQIQPIQESLKADDQRKLIPVTFLIRHELQHLQNNDSVKRELARIGAVGVTELISKTLRTSIFQVPFFKHPALVVGAHIGTGCTKLLCSTMQWYAYKRHEEKQADYKALQYFKNPEKIDFIIQYIDNAFTAVYDKPILDGIKAQGHSEEVARQMLNQYKEKNKSFMPFLYAIMDPEHPTTQARKNQALRYKEKLIAEQENQGAKK